MKTLCVVYIALVVLALSACQKPKQDTATVPPGVDAQCVNNPTLCQSNVYNTPGFTPYNYNNQYNNYNNGGIYGGGYYYQGNYSGNYNGGYSTSPFQNYNNTSYLCNCPSGMVPTYNSYAGLGCVQSSQVYGYGYAYFGWGGANNSQWTNIPQISNYAGYTNSNSGCYNGVVQSCLVDQPNTCAAGYSCQGNSASTRLGFCVATNTIGNNGGYGQTPR